VFYRYLAVDDAGAFALLSHQRLEPLYDETVKLVLLEATEDWQAALRSHRSLEETLRGVRPPDPAIAEVALVPLPLARRGRRGAARTT
jgi:hypothetical protein